ncbi:Cupredoxin superfamily protein [Abeliophyllum distichum]|uniref:Cupredoxin superfamily protein n=1 Tax=Abeliophyllum distichum TaxID=126358 RepID=A0ABD1QVV0_9LAMI
MTNKLELVGWIMVAATLIVVATAATYTVGDELQWTIPPLGDIAYKTWAAKKDFEIGDTIIFNWNGTHNVVQVTKENYDACTSTNALNPIQTTSPASFIANSTESYFICTVGNHCSMGQKVTISTGSSAPTLKTGALMVILPALLFALLSLV